MIYFANDVLQSDLPLTIDLNHNLFRIFYYMASYFITLFFASLTYMFPLFQLTFLVHCKKGNLNRFSTLI